MPDDNKNYDVPEETVKLYHHTLVSDPKKLKEIMDLRGITQKTIEKYVIGYDPSAKRYTIPIPNGFGIYENVRKWRIKDPKMISFATGYGETRIFPITNLINKKNKRVIFCEGEWDCILLNQYGFPAITKTAGVLTWKDEWNDWFKGKDIIFIYDCDTVGRDAAEKHKDKLMSYANSIKIVDLGLKDHEDITDWFTKYKKNSEQLARLIKTSKVKDIYEAVDLFESLDSKYYNKKIKFNCVVIGKDEEPYIIPKKIEACCNTGGNEKSKVCAICNLYGNKHITRELVYETDKEYLTKMLNASDKQVTGVLRELLKLPRSKYCPGSYTVEALSQQNVEEVSVIPEISREVINQEYVIRSCYYFGFNLKINQGYTLKGTTWSDPNNQTGVHLITQAKESKDSITKFILTDAIKENLKIFRPKNDSVEEIKKKLNDIYMDFTYNITRMYDRQDIIMAIDMVYHSVLHFKFCGQFVKKGWLECAVIGDTRCGKSETAEGMVRHYRAGEFITSGEHTSRAGLLGGAQQTKRGSWNVTWGKLVMNNRGVVILDEADELAKKGIIGELSGVRSSGVAELIYIQTQKAMAKTRIIWISNPIWGRMSEHNYGITTLQEIFKTQQDIARVDIVIGVSGEDVPDEVINKRHSETWKHKYKTDYCNQSVLFAWSRSESNIKFQKKAEEKILELAIKFGKIFEQDIPVVVGAEFRIKLAAGATALATRLNSVDETGENVIVKEAHVIVYSDWLWKLYTGKVLGYKDFSDQRKREKQLKDIERIDDAIVSDDMVSLFLDQNKFQVQDIRDILGLDKSEGSDIVAYMRKNRMLKKHHTYLVKTPAFIYYLKKKKEQLKKTGDKPQSKQSRLKYDEINEMDKKEWQDLFNEDPEDEKK
jgi:hypothetical protein